MKKSNKRNTPNMESFKESLLIIGTIMLGITITGIISLAYNQIGNLSASFFMGVFTFYIGLLIWMNLEENGFPFLLIFGFDGFFLLFYHF